MSESKGREGRGGRGGGEGAEGGMSDNASATYIYIHCYRGPDRRVVERFVCLRVLTCCWCVYAVLRSRRCLVVVWWGRGRAAQTRPRLTRHVSPSRRSHGTTHNNTHWHECTHGFSAPCRPTMRDRQVAGPIGLSGWALCLSLSLCMCMLLLYVQCVR